MARTDCSTHSLAWLVVGSVEDLDVLVEWCPGPLLETTFNENTLVCIDQVSSALEDTLNLVVQSNYLAVELVNAQCHPLGNIADQYSLLLQPSLAHDDAQRVSTDPSIWELTMEQHSTASKIQCCLRT